MSEIPTHLCECGDLAEFWVTEDNRLPRPICGRCLGRLQRAVERGDAALLERAAQDQRRTKRKAQRQARRTSRRR